MKPDSLAPVTMLLGTISFLGGCLRLRKTRYDGNLVPPSYIYLLDFEEFELQIFIFYN